MKAKFTTLDIKLLVSELNQKLLGMKVVNIYDIDNKTYLFKFNKTDEKAMLLLESGIRFHTTEFDWPKSIIPSGFAMKLRKHVRGRRLESIRQLGVDRIIDLQFGSGEAAYHVILEVYDRGNIVLTDFEYNILNIQRPRTDDDKDVKFMVREKYPLDLAKHHQCVPSKESIVEILESAKKGDNLRKILNPHLVYGSNLLDHCLMEVGLKGTTKIGNGFSVDQDLDKLMEALNAAEEFMQHCCEGTHKGYIINQKEKKADVLDKEEFVLTYSEFHPFLFKQHSNESYCEFESFDKAVDEFYSKIESQKQDRKIMQQKSTALKKLEHIKLDNQNRVQGLKEEQLIDMQKAMLIELNIDLVEEACAMIRNALAHQVDWTDLTNMIEEASTMSSVVACIASIKLETNVMTMLLSPPENMAEELDLSPMKVDINLGMSAYSNARQYYDLKKHATSKEMKTTDALQKAYKSVEKKTIKTLKDVQTVATINKARKTYWFEKFLWFISSENYVIIGGRDMQQNEMIVKRYLRPGDIYVHADLNGASSVIIKNPTKKPVPPVTLNEAGAMALCNSAAWDARVVTSSWWVYHDQVSKTAPSGEYLTTGSFMIRGKKNYLLPSNMIYGFGFLFKLDETCLEKHKNERRVKGMNEDECFDDVKEQEEELVVEEDNNDDDVQEPTAPSCNNDLEAIEEVQEPQDEPDAFPDTEVKFNLDNASNNAVPDNDETKEKGNGKARMTAKQKRDAKKPNGENKGAKKEEKAVAKENPEEKGHKRIQQGKLKMMKKKYGDQDEEDRELKIKLNAAAGAPKDKKSNKKDKENIKPENNQKTGNKKQEPVKKPVTDKIVSKPVQEDSAVMEEELDDEVENKQIQQELEVLDSLTGIPLPDDVLHYCIPVCAPWNALKNYRFKVKLTPGTGKKGKAAKTAIGMFMQDKSTTSLEKDLFKSVKDSDLARNMPGKVKVSVAKIQK